MCMQDIRIGQRLTGSGGNVPLGIGLTATLVPANSGRLRVTVSLRPDLVAVSHQSVLIQALEGGSGRTVAVLTGATPSALLRVEDYGDDLYNLLQAVNLTGAAVSVDVREYTAQSGLEGV